MTELMFYQLTDAPLETLIPVLAEKALERGWRVAIQGPVAERLAFLDDKLWNYRSESFLPHAPAGGADDKSQPVLLGPVGPAANGAQMLVLIDGAAFKPESLAAYERVCVVFDGNDAQMLEGARAQWRAVSQAGLAASYWARDAGRWQQKATSAAH